ncbi:hypothetical protein R6Q59_022445 [Mikania micrantha]
MASVRFISLLLVVVIISSASTHDAIGTGGRRISESKCELCCNEVDCDTHCKKTGKGGLCKPYEGCDSGEICCCAT